MTGVCSASFYGWLPLYLPELFPTRVRAAGQGFCYNAGRALAGLAPVTVGALADRYGIGAALAFTSLFFLAGAAVMTRLTARPKMIS